LIITITTDKGSYIIACTDVVSSPKNLDDVGICQLRIIHEAEMDSSTAWHDGDGDTPGVRCFK
jgi:hypothetical protein